MYCWYVCYECFTDTKHKPVLTHILSLYYFVPHSIWVRYNTALKFKRETRKRKPEHIHDIVSVSLTVWWAAIINAQTSAQLKVIVVVIMGFFLRNSGPAIDSCLYVLTSVRDNGLTETPRVLLLFLSLFFICVLSTNAQQRSITFFVNKYCTN